jgi:hypothetical protein
VHTNDYTANFVLAFVPRRVGVGEPPGVQTRTRHKLRFTNGCFLVAFWLLSGSCLLAFWLVWLIFAVAVVLLRMLLDVKYLVEYVVEYVMEYVLVYLASFWLLSGCVLVAFWLLSGGLLFVVAHVPPLMLFAVAYVVE